MRFKHFQQQQYHALKQPMWTIDEKRQWVNPKKVSSQAPDTAWYNGM